METLAWGLLDLLLITILLALAWGALTGRDTQRAVVQFIGFGLLLALIWVRLRAPDIALAEAAIGAGLTGALLLAALRDTPDSAPHKDQPGALQSNSPFSLGAGLTLLCGGLAVLLAMAYLEALEQADPVRLADQIHNHLQQTGVSNPVTGVLLNFRAYDTLLELAVMLAALLGILALGPARPAYLASGTMLSGLSRWLTPFLILFSGYLLWAGAHAPGGAFQAGALLAGAGVLLRLAGFPDQQIPPAMVLRGLIIAGVGLFLAVGLGLMLTGRGFLDYPPAWAGGLILLIETAATLSIAATLLLAFLGGAPEHWTALPGVGRAVAAPGRSKHGEKADV